MPGISNTLRPMLAVVALLSSVAISSAHSTSTDTCWDRHWTVWTLIEDLGELPNFQDHRLSEALLSALHAHKLCREGREAEALATYDEIVHGLSPVRLAR